jgi:hypothetical protein
MNSVLLIALSLLAGCATAATPHDAGVRLGQVVDVGGLRVRPDLVIEDSRCPIGVQCVWAGRVVLRATLLGGRGIREVDLTLGSPARIDGGTLTLVAVAPDRSVGGQTETQQLRFTFAFEGSG